jgi:DNA-binding beta-propeller fold protein YncE
MSKKAFRLMVLCASGALAVVLLPNAPNFGVVQGQTPQQGRAAPATSGEARNTIQLERAPARVIHDPHSSFSAVAVDLSRDEIILEDENLGQINVYNRLDNTPPQAGMTEPKRTIGGSRAKINLNCGVYVDPFSGDIYSVNGDTTDWMTVWTREQKGNVPASRELQTPHRAFGIAIDEDAKEIYITIEHSPAVVVFRKTAANHEPPIRILEGDKTQLADVHGIALDTKNQLLYVSNQGATARNLNNVGWARAVKDGTQTWEVPAQGDAWRNFVPGSGAFLPPSITVYPLKAGGDTPPLRVLRGPLTRFNWPAHISLDVERNELFVANTITDEILVFRATDTGNVAPIRVLKGSKTYLKNPHGVFVDTKNNELIVANFGNHSSTVYPRTAAGDTAPIRVIRAAPPDTPAPMFGNIGSLAYDTKRDELLVPN